MKIRLDKYLTEMSVGSRSEVKKAIIKGLTEVNGETVKKPEQKIDPALDQVCFQGRRITYVAMEYYMLNKPAGVVSATEDPRDKTVIDLIEDRRRKDLFPAGRLDKDTEGLLLITNDGALAHDLLSPKKHVDKKYCAKIEGTVTEEDVELFGKGVDIGEKRVTLPAVLTILSSGEESEITLTIREGKFHQVKRMFEAVGKKVVYLKREEFGGLSLDADLEEGEYRELSDEELALLKSY